MNTNLEYINQICTDLGGTGGHVTNVAGENEICTLLGGTGGHTLEIDALNEICTLQSVTGSHSLNLEALKSIGAGSFKTNLEAWSYIQSSSVLNLTIRGNIVGKTLVTKQSYDTNSSATWRTVGASGANYTSLATAYVAAPLGSVIEIIDDSISLTEAYNFTKVADANGKAIKIKGKATKTTINLFNTTYPLMLSQANSCIEFENINFVSTSNIPIYNLEACNNGFLHFINCTFNFTGSIYLYSSKETVFDNVSFIGCTAYSVMKVVIANVISDTAKLIINAATINNTTPTYFVETVATGTKKLNTISITNSELICGVGNPAVLMALYYNNIDFRGNYSNTLLHVANEISGTAVPPYTNYNAGTTYAVGSYTCYLYNLWKCKAETTGNAPALNSAYWEVAKIVTGTIENNTIIRETYSAQGHGIFLGYGAHGFSVKNNIVSNFAWNYVVKGVENTIEYNCAGKGLNGFSVFANEQTSVRNNTSRGEDGFGLRLAPQATGGTSVVTTDFKYNISTYDIAAKIGLFASYNVGDTIDNEFTGNIYYGVGMTATFNGTTYDLTTQFAAFKTAVNDSKAQFINPQYIGADHKLPDYYKPSNPVVLKMKDDLNQAIGAVDYKP